MAASETYACAACGRDRRALGRALVKNLTPEGRAKLNDRERRVLDRHQAGHN